MKPTVLMPAFWLLLISWKYSVNSADSVLSVGARRKKYLKFRSVRAAELEQPHMKIFFMRSATALAGLVEELL